MNFDLSEEQELFRATVERFTAPIDVEARRRLRANTGGYDLARWRDLAELGLIALAASEEAGGMGGSPLDLALVGEAVGRGNAPDPWLENGVLPARLLAAGNALEALEGVLAGTSFVTFAWAERSQRYSLQPKQTRVEGGTITGEKTFVLGAALADHFIVSARAGETTEFYLLPRDAEGLEVRSYRLADGSMAGEVRLTRVATSAGRKLELDEAALDQIVAEVRLVAAAEMAGLGQRLLDDTLRYVKEREQFGVPIGSFQALQHRLVDCYARIEQARSMLYRAALADPADARGWQRSAAGAKAYISEAADHIAREAVQMHGGMGITDELAIGHAMKRVLLLMRLFGDVDANLVEYAAAA
ncbi:MAG: acyl-CoA dehydrogenase family protein [Erythrobacter sp.]